MAYNATNTRTSIRELLEGSIGSVRTVPAATFKSGVFPGQTEQAQKASAVQTSTGRHWFDVVLGALENHPDTSVSANGSRRLAIASLTILIVSAVRSTAEASQRSTDLATIASDCDAAIQALHYRNNLRQTSTGGATDIVSGLMVGPGGSGAPQWELTEEDWPAGLIRSQITGSVIVEVTQSVEADPITFAGSSLVGWWRGDSVIQNPVSTEVSQLLDKTGHGNHLIHGNTARQPEYSLTSGPNSTPALTFDGSGHTLACAGSTLGTSTYSYTLWMVVKVTTWTNGSLLFTMWTADGTKTYDVKLLTGAQRWAHVTDGNTGAAVTTTSTTGATTGGWHLVRVFMDDANDLQGISVDNASDTTSADTTAVPAIVNHHLASYGGVNYAPMVLADAWLVSGKYTAAMATSAVSYVNTRYALGL